MNISKFASFCLGFMAVAFVFAAFYFVRFVAMPHAPALVVTVVSGIAGAAIVLPMIAFAEAVERHRP